MPPEPSPPLESPEVPASSSSIVPSRSGSLERSGPAALREAALLPRLDLEDYVPSIRNQGRIEGT